MSNHCKLSRIQGVDRVHDSKVAGVLWSNLKLRSVKLLWDRSSLAIENGENEPEISSPDISVTLLTLKEGLNAIQCCQWWQ